MTITSTATMTRNTTRSTRASDRLRIVLTANAATSAIVGVAGLVAADWATTELGIGSVAWIRTVSCGLLVFAAAVGAVAWRSGHQLARAAVAISAADIAWVAATIAVVALVDLTTLGTLVAVVLGVGVGDFAALQLWFAAKQRRWTAS